MKKEEFVDILETFVHECKTSDPRDIDKMIYLNTYGAKIGEAMLELIANGDAVIQSGSEAQLSKKTDNPIKHKHGEYNHVMLSDDEFSRLKEDYGEKITAEYITELDEYLENNRKKHYANHNLTIRNWLKRNGVCKISEVSADCSFDLGAIMEHAKAHTPQL